MPVLQRFAGFVIRMYFRDHNPPHVHVEGPDFRGLVSIKDAVLFEGEIDPRFVDEALDWVTENGEWLFQKWDEFSA